MGQCSAIPSPQQNVCAGPWGLVRVRQPETEEPTMVQHVDLDNTRRSAKRRRRKRIADGSTAERIFRSHIFRPERLRAFPEQRPHPFQEAAETDRAIDRAVWLRQSRPHLRRFRNHRRSRTGRSRQDARLAARCRRFVCPISPRPIGAPTSSLIIGWLNWRAGTASCWRANCRGCSSLNLTTSN